MPKTSIVFAAALAVVMSASAAHAQATQVVEKFKDWVLYSHTGQPAKICFISAQPREKKPSGYAKEPSYFYISAWPDNGIKAEVSVNIGKDLESGSGVTVQIGGSRYRLFTKGNKAFVEQPNDEIKLIEAMKKGSFMVVRATVSDGTAIEETYSLLGVTAAVNSLRRGCR